MTVGIIGGGASGMAAAIEAGKYADVLIFERQNRLGRKLSATGNGRCNLSNVSSDIRHYHGICPDFTEHAFHVFSPKDTLAWFSSMGLTTVTDESGKVYPYSDQANSVVDILRYQLLRSNISVLAGEEIVNARNADGTFELCTAEHTYHCDKLIVACGGLAGTELGGSMSGYKLLKKFGHTVSPLRPSIVQLKTDWRGVASLKGVRGRCRVKILHNGEVFTESIGEIQFTDYGISGPVIMEISRDVCREKGDWRCILDFLPDGCEPDFDAKRQLPLSAEELLIGTVHNRLGRVLVKEAGIEGGRSISSLNDGDIKRIVSTLHGFEIRLTEPMGFDKAQVTAGGVLTSEFDPTTMESKIIPGLYACGEVLDIDGDCGGFNLQWAWSSGRLAGRNAGMKMQ